MKCPNCQSENVQKLKTGKILCPGCDTVFSIEQDGAKVAQTDVLENLDQRVSALEKEKPAQPPQKDNPDEPTKAEPTQPAQQGDDDQGEGTDDNIFDE